MALKRMTKRELIIFIICLIVIFIFIGVNFIVKPLLEQYEKFSNEITRRKELLAEYHQKLRQGKSIGDIYKKFSQPLLQKLSDEAEMAAILSEIESVANEIDLRVSDMKPKRVKRTEFFNTFLVSLSLEGDLASITRFLYVLQNNPHLFEVDEVQLQKRSLRTSRIKCQLVLSRSLIFQ